MPLITSRHHSTVHPTVHQPIEYPCFPPILRVESPQIVGISPGWTTTPEPRPRFLLRQAIVSGLCNADSGNLSYIGNARRIHANFAGCVPPLTSTEGRPNRDFPSRPGCVTNERVQNSSPRVRRGPSSAGSDRGRSLAIRMLRIGVNAPGARVLSPRVSRRLRSKCAH
jgi:hypothetical protein